jgi:hypothetical protein
MALGLAPSRHFRIFPFARRVKLCLVVTLRPLWRTALASFVLNGFHEDVVYQEQRKFARRLAFTVIIILSFARSATTLNPRHSPSLARFLNASGSTSISVRRPIQLNEWLLPITPSHFRVSLSLSLSLSVIRVDGDIVIRGVRIAGLVAAGTAQIATIVITDASVETRALQREN